ncbi:MAG: 16S rRNA (uracil(1498)-N(3))-methyltransferase [candidate division Zixibacteria bacterium]|nr:16S rRNA (uracil(1498)-N(3))-methyltransferase [candidate division Zixibacteria bacterium]MBU1469941.1 16S rRNA (uracil(1498)-N(3))-methyltransferase [candidate division Zixibacteria bacterium]MBU2626960.1 16S rRNA (uracil(1498)-N(3))-methyltransferase [candidate division Zixibacteria bacterium]
MTIRKADFTYFLVSEADIHGDEVTFSADESRHITKVCRMKAGDTLSATDGEGRLLEVRIESITKTGVIGQIVRATTQELPTKLCHLAMPIAVSQKTDWVIEKCTELGVDRFHIFSSEHSTSKSSGSKRLDRCRRVALSAIKQSMRRHAPNFEQHESVASLTRVFADYSLVAYGHFDEDTDTLSQLLASDKFDRILVLVGPEAGFTDEEIQILKSAGAVAVRYGNHRLRMETAAIVLPTLVIESFQK